MDRQTHLSTVHLQHSDLSCLCNGAYTHTPHVVIGDLEFVQSRGDIVGFKAPLVSFDSTYLHWGLRVLSTMQDQTAFSIWGSSLLHIQ